MDQTNIIGLDIAKQIFQAHGADSGGAVLFRKKLRRHQVLSFFAGLAPCTVAMEACPGAHHWGREITKLGHTVKLIAPAYVKPFVKRQKNDAADAEAICEAAQRPTMRFVVVKSQEAQAAAIVFRTRDLLVRQRTQAINALRGHLAEFGVIAAKGVPNLPKLIAIVEDPGADLPEVARIILTVLAGQLRALDERVAVLDREIARRAKEDPVARRLMTIPGVGAVTATALMALAPAASTFRRGRDFAAWLASRLSSGRRAARSGWAGPRKWESGPSRYQPVRTTWAKPSAVVLIGLVEPHLQGGLHASGVQTHNVQSGAAQAVNKPRGHRSCLDADLRIDAGTPTHQRCNGRWLRCTCPAPMTATVLIHHANCGRLLRNVQSHI